MFHVLHPISKEYPMRWSLTLQLDKNSFLKIGQISHKILARTFNVMMFFRISSKFPRALNQKELLFW